MEIGRISICYHKLDRIRVISVSLDVNYWRYTVFLTDCLTDCSAHKYISETSVFTFYDIQESVAFGENDAKN